MNVFNRLVAVFFFGILLVATPLWGTCRADEPAEEIFSKSLILAVDNMRAQDGIEALRWLDFATFVSKMMRLTHGDGVSDSIRADAHKLANSQYIKRATEALHNNNLPEAAAMLDLAYDHAVQANMSVALTDDLKKLITTASFKALEPYNVSSGRVVTESELTKFRDLILTVNALLEKTH